MFNEFSNPESADYDITSSLKEEEKEISVHTPSESEKYIIEIADLVGFLEDGEWEEYGITEEEYMNATEETVNKIKAIVAKREEEQNKTR